MMFYFKTCIRLLLILLISLSSVQAVLAHEGRPVYIEVTAMPLPTKLSTPASASLNTYGYQLKWKIPPVMQAGDEPLISLSGESCEMLDSNASIISAAPQRLIGQLRYQCMASSDDLEAQALIVKLVYPRSNPVLSSLVVFNNHEGISQHFFSGPETLEIKISEKSSAFEVAMQYTQGGVKHILEGYDHLLFVFCLIVLAESFARILVAVTGFTLAHTLTLILSTLGWLSLPIVFVEILIVLSVVVLAAEILRGRRAANNSLSAPSSLTWRYPVIVASGFGLLHGFGFASVLGGLGLPPDLKITALMFFNIGVELGQVAFILVVLALAWLSRYMIVNQSYQIKAVNSVVFLIGILSSYWLFERLLLI